MKAKLIEGTPAFNSLHVIVIGDCFASLEGKDGFTKAAEALCGAIINSLGFKGGTGLCIWIVPDAVPATSDPPLAFACANPPPNPPKSRFHCSVTQDTEGDCCFLAGDPDRVDAAVAAADFGGVNTAIRKTIVLVGYDGYGGSNYSNYVWATLNGGQVSSVALHELGHSFGLYEESEQDCKTGDPKKVTKIDEENVTSYPNDPRWKSQCDNKYSPDIVKKKYGSNCSYNAKSKQPIVGSFQGAYYTHKKHYRPSMNCRMRETTVPFCKVCSKFLAKQLTP